MWRAILELYGVSARYLRSPQLSATEEDMEVLRASLDQIGLLPHVLKCEAPYTKPGLAISPGSIHPICYLSQTNLARLLPGLR